ncbi:PEP-CTERM sorting domain-containing protein [Coraliomargarita sp. W4R72]
MKALLTIGVACTTLAINTFAQLVDESFDYGAGVRGRSNVSFGTPLNVANVQSGTGIWRTTGDSATFAGQPGPGNGSLDMTTATNTTASTALDFSTGVLTSTVEFTMTTQGSNGSAGFYFGFQSSSPDNNLLTNQDSDTIWVKVSERRIGFRARINGTTRNLIGDINWISGDSGSISIAYDLPNNTVTATVTSEGHEIYKGTNTFTVPSSYKPDLGAVALNAVTMDTLEIQGVHVDIPEPTTMASLFGTLALTLAISRRNRQKL